MCAAFFLSAKDTFQRPPATRWTGIFQNFFCFSNPGTWALATGGAEKFSFHSLQHRVLKFAKRNGKFSSCYLLRTKIKNAKRTTKKAANLFQTYCFHWPRRLAAGIQFYMAFQMKQKANTHPHALPVCFLTNNIPYIAMNVVIISTIPQKDVLNGCSKIQMMAQVNAP